MWFHIILNPYLLDRDIYKLGTSTINISKYIWIPEICNTNINTILSYFKAFLSSTTYKHELYFFCT